VAAGVRDDQERFHSWADAWCGLEELLYWRYVNLMFTFIHYGRDLYKSKHYVYIYPYA
jgi:hypothetical protein